MGSFVPICTISFRGVSLFSSIANINNLIDDFTLCYDPTLHYITFGKVTTPVSLKIVPNFKEQQKIPLFHTFFHFFEKNAILTSILLFDSFNFMYCDGKKQFRLSKTV